MRSPDDDDEKAPDFSPSPTLYTHRHTWFSRYLTPPVRELLDAGPLARQILSKPRHARVCVLFTDIRGFTELSRTMIADDLINTVDAHIARQSYVVERYGGYVDNFTGDGLMAIFEGATMAESACRCALDVAAISAKAARDSLVATVPVGVGLHVGDVVMGNLGDENRCTYTALGDAVNIAARLCNQAEGRAAIASDTVRERMQTQRQTPNGLAFETLAQGSPAGVDQDLPVYRLKVA